MGRIETGFVFRNDAGRMEDILRPGFVKTGLQGGPVDQVQDHSFAGIPTGRYVDSMNDGPYLQEMPDQGPSDEPV
jgi:hypothetical protein